jgi:DNA-binding IclR family transcriptional regulator
VNDGSSRNYTAPAVELSCRILQYLAGYAHSHATLSQIATTLRASKSSCLRVLRVLERERFVEYNEAAKVFSLGTYLFVLGSRAASQVDVLAMALPYVAQAAKTTGLTCVLVERYGPAHYMYIAKEEPATPLRISVAVGQRFPLASGSHGKCFLAWLPPSEASAILDRYGLPRFTEKSITDPAAYLKGLAAVRHRVTLTMTAIGTSAQMDRAALRQTGEVLKELAARISACVQDSRHRGRVSPSTAPRVAY